MNNKILVVIIVIIVAAGGFFAGMQYQKMQRQSFMGGKGGAVFQQRFGGAGFGGQNANIQAVRGQILNAGNGTMTIKMNDGSTKLVVLSGSTKITKAATASQSDLKTGQTVMVVGSSNSDGSVTAQSVQLNPVGGFMRMHPSGNPNPTQ